MLDRAVSGGAHGWAVGLLCSGGAVVREAPDLLFRRSATCSTEQMAKGAHNEQSGLPCSGRAASGIYWVDAHAPCGTSESPTRGKCKGTHGSGAAMKPDDTPVKQLVAQLASQTGCRPVRRVYSPNGRADRPCVLGIALCRNLAEDAQAAHSARVALGWPSNHTVSDWWRSWRPWWDAG